MTNFQVTSMTYHNFTILSLLQRCVQEMGRCHCLDTIVAIARFYKAGEYRVCGRLLIKDAVSIQKDIIIRRIATDL